jgi:hypothetical protein
MAEFSHLFGREQDIIREALDSGYTTDKAPEWLVTFVASTPYFLRDGQYYELDNPFPSYTIYGEIVTEDEVDGRIASVETYREAVTHDGLVSTGIARLALQDGGLKEPYLWDDFLTFVETYEAFDNPYGEDLVSLTVEHENPEPPYTITAAHVSPTEVSEESIWDATNAPAEVTSVVAAAGEKEGLYGVDSPPTELLDQLDAHQYVYLDGTFYTTYIEKAGELPVSIDATLTDASLADSARIELSLTNHDDEEVEISAGAPKPFGVLRFYPHDNSDERFLLWTDDYEENSHVKTDDHSILRIEEVAELLQLKPRETVRREFHIEQSDLKPGQYIIESDVRVRTLDGMGGTLPYRVVFSVSN